MPIKPATTPAIIPLTRLRSFPIVVSRHEFGGAEHLALRIDTVGQALALLIVPISGWLSDRAWTRRAALIAAFGAEAIISWGAFELVGSHGVAGLWLAQLPFAFRLAIIMGVPPAMLAEQFPRGLSRQRPRGVI